MKERTILWIFLAFVLGFSLPVCSCAGSGFLMMSTVSRWISDPSMASSGLGDAIAVIRLDGTIASTPADSFSLEGISPQNVQNMLQTAAENPDIKAVVVRINSPGGSVVASDEIYHAFLDFEKPIVVWMDEIAASGGYYISCGADYTFAHPDTLTGSIGVISQFINAEDLLEDIGVDVMVITTGPYKDTGSMFREMTSEERTLWEAIITETYDGFVEVVAEARGMTTEEVQELADGRIYTGRQALSHGLVDAVGTSEDAIAKAAELGGIEGEPRIIELKTTPGFSDLLRGVQGHLSGMPSLTEILGWAGSPSLQFRFAGP